MKHADWPDDLSKWQAGSHPDLADRTPDKLFHHPFPEKYQRLHRDIWQRMIHIHGTILSLETLEAFPFDYVYGPGYMGFWDLVRDNFMAIAIVMLHGLVNDKGGDALCIDAFKAEIIRANWRDCDIKALLQETLKERKFEAMHHAIADSIARMRSQHIAHCLIDRKTGYAKSQPEDIQLADLRTLFDAIHKLFGALSFGSSYVTLAGDLIPGSTTGKPAQTCLDSVLAAVAKCSDWVCEPEQDSYWQQIKNSKSQEEIHALKALRARIGLPTV